MFGLFGPELAAFIDERAGRVTFASQRSKKPGSTVKLRFDLVGASQPKLVLPVQILHSRKGVPGPGFICAGTLSLPPSEVPRIAQLLRDSARRADSQLPGRRVERLAATVKVVSRQLPSYAAISADLSPLGARIHCQAAVAVGTVAELQLETDLASVGVVTVKGKVVWCTHQPAARNYACGFEFQDVTPEIRDALLDYCRYLAARERGDIQQKQIMEGEINTEPARAASTVSTGSGLLGPPPPPPPNSSGPLGPPPPPPSA